MSTRATLTERHRALNLQRQTDRTAWTVGNNGSGRRNWFALRNVEGRTGGPYEYYSDKHGEMIWLTEAGALKRAELLNAETAA
jgi:hypothetical protein